MHESIVQRSRARLEAKAADLRARIALYRSCGYHASADVLYDRLELVNWQPSHLRPDGSARSVSGKVLVTPSIQAQFEHPAPKPASVSTALNLPLCPRGELP